MKSLQRTAFDALTRSAFVLPAHASREEFEEYVSTTWTDGSTHSDWLYLIECTGINEDTDAILEDLCCELEPRYPWGSSEPAWDLWCFCAARWARENDVRAIELLSFDGFELDHRHAFCLSGPSAAKNPEYVEKYVLINRRNVGADWGTTLVRPEMWDGGHLVRCWINARGKMCRRGIESVCLSEALLESARVDNPAAAAELLACAEIIHDDRPERSMSSSYCSEEDMLTVLRAFARTAPATV
nr:hypothetical protein TetV2_00160 [Oceanusvirus sp.]